MNEINTELEKKIKQTLYEGQIIKNEMELFRMLELIKLNDKDIGGNKKKKLKKDISAFLKYEKVKGNSIKILEIYEEPLIVSDKRVEGKYITYIETILLNYLLQQEDNSIDITFRKLFELLGMNNQYYNDYTYKSKLQKYDDRFTDFQTTDFFIRSYSLMRKTIVSALDSLSRRNKIRCIKNTIIKKIGAGFEDKHIASDTEHRIIMKVEDTVMEQMNIKDKSILFLKGLSSKFYSKVKEIIREEYNWLDYYDEFHIILNTKNSLLSGLEDNILKLNKYILNQNIIQTINDDAKNKYERQNIALKKEWNEAVANNALPKGIGLCNSFETFLNLRNAKDKLYPEDYIIIQKMLSRFFLSIVPEDQKALIEFIKEKQIEINECDK